MIGGTGVHLFFILSGFGLGLSSQKTSIYYFFRNRFTKILVPYYLTIVSIFTINSIYPIYKNVSLYELGGHFFLYKMFDENIIGSFGYHYWFISTIVQFYIVFPLIILLKEKSKLSLFLVISLLLSASYWIIISFYNISDKRIFNSFFLQYIWEFNIGIILADSYLRKKKYFWEHNNIILALFSIIGIATMGFMAINGGRLGKTFNDIPASIGYFCLSALAFSICKKYFGLLKTILSYIGKLSYELYLVHMLVFILLNDTLESVTKIKSNIFMSILIILPLSIYSSHLFSTINNLLYKKMTSQSIGRRGDVL